MQECKIENSMICFHVFCCFQHVQLFLCAWTYFWTMSATSRWAAVPSPLGWSSLQKRLISILAPVRKPGYLIQSRTKKGKWCVWLNILKISSPQVPHKFWTSNLTSIWKLWSLQFDKSRPTESGINLRLSKIKPLKGPESFNQKMGEGWHYFGILQIHTYIYICKYYICFPLLI